MIKQIPSAGGSLFLIPARHRSKSVFLTTICLILLAISVSFGQRMRDNYIKFKYIQLPPKPLPLHLETYTELIKSPYLDRIDSLRNTCTDEEFRYLLQMEEWESQSPQIEDPTDEESDDRFLTILKIAAYGLNLALGEEEDRVPSALKMTQLGLTLVSEEDNPALYSALGVSEFGIGIASRFNGKSREKSGGFKGDLNSFGFTPYLPQRFDKHQIVSYSSRLRGFDERPDADITTLFELQGFTFSAPKPQLHIDTVVTNRTVLDTSVTDRTVSDTTISVDSSAETASIDTLITETVITDTAITKRIVSDTAINHSYTLSLEYQHPVSCTLRVENEIVRTDQINAAESYRSKHFPNADTLTQWWIENKQQILFELDRSYVESHISLFYSTLNKSYGYFLKSGVSQIVVPRSRKQSYDDFSEALNLADSGFHLLKDDRDRAEASRVLNRAIDIWETALIEAQPNTRRVKRARVNLDVILATYLNIIETAIYANEFEKASAYLKLFYNLAKRRSHIKRADSLNRRMVEQKSRFKAREAVRNSQVEVQRLKIMAGAILR